MPLSKTAFKDSRKQIAEKNSTAECAWVLNATSYYRFTCNNQCFVTYALKTIHFVSCPLTSIFVALVLFGFLRTFFQYTFVMGVINWMNLLNINYKIPLNDYALMHHGHE